MKDKGEYIRNGERLRDPAREMFFSRYECRSDSISFLIIDTLHRYVSVNSTEMFLRRVSWSEKTVVRVFSCLVRLFMASHPVWSVGYSACFPSIGFRSVTPIQATRERQSVKIDHPGHYKRSRQDASSVSLVFLRQGRMSRGSSKRCIFVRSITFVPFRKTSILCYCPRLNDLPNRNHVSRVRRSLRNNGYKTPCNSYTFSV